MPKRNKSRKPNDDYVLNDEESVVFLEDIKSQEHDELKEYVKRLEQAVAYLQDVIKGREAYIDELEAYVGHLETKTPPNRGD